MGKTMIVGRSERFTALITVIALHVLAFALVLAGRSPAAPPVAEGSLRLIALQAETPAPTKPPPPRLPSKSVDEILLAKAIAFSTGTDTNAQAVAVGTCSTLDVVARAVVEDPAAVQSVLDSPPETRSIAGAVVIWNAGWTPAAKSLDAPLGPARAVVERSLSGIDENCLDEPVAGPRLVAIPAGEGTMFLVFGSGQWTWRDITLAFNAQPAVQDRFDYSISEELRNVFGDRPQ